MHSCCSTNNGQIEVNVGGTIFFTSISTLTGYSSYFKAKFSQEWNNYNNKNDDNDSNQTPSIFIDQNPEPFRILLSFMRSGCISSVDVCRMQVLLQAEYLGIHDLLCAVKYRAYRNKHPEVCAAPQDVIDMYDQNYGGAIKSSIALGILPRYILHREVRKEYALLGKSAGRFLVQGPKRLFENNENEKKNKAVDGKSSDSYSYSYSAEQLLNDHHHEKNHHCLSAESGLVPLSPLFLDCLNWLGVHGFTKLDIPECVVQDGIRRIFFSRPLVADTMECEEHNYLNNLIVDHHDLSSSSNNADGSSSSHQKNNNAALHSCKQFAQLTVVSRSIVPELGGIGMLREVAKIEADLGKTTKMSIGGQEVTSRISKVVGIHEATTVSCMNWLQRNGYTTREPDLEEFYRDSQSAVSNNRNVSIFSRSVASSQIKVN